MATAKEYGAAVIYRDDGTTERYGSGLFNRRSLTVTRQGIINAIMSGIGSRVVGSALPSRRMAGPETRRRVRNPWARSSAG
ncbi:hypothetical protein ACFZBP_13265 [Streptomyces sp. NPDC008086]|uniref:hypothetical protein n=1 Tax=Streptomyces sp. NPDC008086 TaxID=3364807 RepID=UPI0036F13021